MRISVCVVVDFEIRAFLVKNLGSLRWNCIYLFPFSLVLQDSFVRGSSKVRFLLFQFCNVKTIVMLQKNKKSNIDVSWNICV